MARIISFRVEGLAGRDAACSGNLNSDVTVFYGVNGSGKTTLLKIFHSALSSDESILEGLPFKSAEIEVYLNRYEATFKRRFEFKESQQAGESDVSVYSAVSPILGGEAKRAKWLSDPEEPEGGLTHYKQGYLPITRLYRTVKRSPEGVGTISEEELDARFAESVKRLWVDYYADISSQISQAQAFGLANILHLVLSGEEPGSDEDSVASTDEAYKRVSDFLSRQPGFEHVLESEGEFAKKYHERPQIRSIVKQIDQIERTIEEVTAPRSRLKHLLESMYSGNKKIVLTERDVGVEIIPKRRISLPSLSSGEKQLFFILLAALRAANHSLIIDEPELSMHVDWQKKLVRSLRELNPKMQLIMATHAPEIMADLSDSNIFSL